MIIKTLTFSPGRHRLFEYILDISLTYEAFFCHLLNRGGIKTPSPGSMIAMFPKHCKEGIGIRAALDFSGIMTGDTPDMVPIAILKMPDIEDAYPMGTTPGTMNRMQSGILSPIFLRFFETHKPLWVSKCTGNPDNWPGICRFAWVVRNAIGHDQKIAWHNEKAPSVQWRGLSYSPRDHGRAILGPDISAADLVFLMIELNEELDRLG